MASSPNIETAQFSAVGREGAVNEDSVVTVLVAGDLQGRLGADTVIAVAVGSASGMAIQTVRSLFAGEELSSLNNGEEAVNYLIRTANREIFNACDPSGPALSATSMTVAAFGASTYLIGQVGDNRAYRLDRAGISQINEDDAQVAEMTELQARTSPLRKSVGIDLLLSPTVITGVWVPGDLILLCSDRLAEHLEAREIYEVLSRHADLQEGCRKLVDTANARGALDNITIAVARNISRPIRERGADGPPADIPGTEVPRVIKPKARGPFAWINVALLALVIVAGVYSRQKLDHEKPAPLVKPTPPKDRPVVPPIAPKPACGLEFNVDQRVFVLRAPPEYEIDVTGSPDDHRFHHHGKEVWVSVRDVAGTTQMLSENYRLAFAEGNRVLVKSDKAGAIPMSALPPNPLTLVLLQGRDIDSRMLDFSLKLQKKEASSVPAKIKP